MLKKQLIRAVEKLPGYREVERRLFFRYVKRLRTDAGSRLARATNHTIERGIFAGMKIHPEESWGTEQFTVLSGQYESELYDIIAAAAAKKPDAFIDIGCANGFYAVGFAMISKGCDVIAYDIDENARRITAENAELNGVSGRISINTMADHAALAETISRYKSVFMLIDIEGAELTLIDPSRCPALRNCDILIEVHGRTDEVAETLANRFAGSHIANVISRQPRNPFQFNGIGCTFEDEAWVLVSEGRGIAKNNWLLLERNF